jgi:peroxiredoxin Q/BCP
MNGRFSAILALIIFAGFVTFISAGVPKVGDSAPGFSLLSEKGDTVTLSAFRDKKNVVLVFYPGDQTPVCTKQLCEIRDDYAGFEERDAVVFGINPADRASHAKFTQKHGYQFPLLIDEKQMVSALYGVKGAMTVRTVFIIAKNGTVAYVKKGKPPVAAILQNIPRQ